MPEDIGPRLRVIRPKSRVSQSRERHTPGTAIHSAGTSRSSAGTARSTSTRTITPNDGHHIELLEYEWPDLPPIVRMKDAITTRRVSSGISYLLPVDKGMNSINHKYRTDLRSMFQEPYATEYPYFDENLVKLSANIHFSTNQPGNKWTKKHMEGIPKVLNSDSENARKLYARSAPSSGNRGTATDVNYKTRSSLYLPIKAKAAPESEKIRKEIEHIIQSAEEDAEDYDTEKYKDGTDAIEQKVEQMMAEERDNNKSFRRVSYRMSLTGDGLGGLLGHYNPTLKLTAEQFETYDELVSTKPPTPVIPDRFCSRYLSQKKNQCIWDWLHYGEGMSDFDFFLSVCG